MGIIVDVWYDVQWYGSYVLLLCSLLKQQQVREVRYIIDSCDVLFDGVEHNIMHTSTSVQVSPSIKTMSKLKAPNKSLEGVLDAGDMDETHILKRYDQMLRILIEKKG